MPTVTKNELFERGIELAIDFARENGRSLPIVRDDPRLASTGLYSHVGRGRNARISVNVAHTAFLVNNPTVRRQSRPGWKTDRTATGVVQHELGHHMWYCASREAHTVWRDLIRTSHRDLRVSGYEPNVEEAFAETFRLFVLNPRLLKAALPHRYGCLTDAFDLKPTEFRHWRNVLPATFHGRALQWVERSRLIIVR